MHNITDVLNGFVMQKTDFPFIYIILDDASIDGKQEVVGNLKQLIPWNVKKYILW